MGTKIREMPTGQLSNDNDYFAVALNDGTTAKIPWSAIVAKIVSDNIAGTNGIDVSVNNNVATLGISADDLTQIITPATLSPDSFYIVQTGSGLKKIAWGSIYGQLLLGSIKQGDHITLTQKTSFPFEVTISADAGRDGTDGVTPHIDNTTKHWMIGETDTNVVAEGQDGEQGQQGANGYSVSIAVSPITGGHRLVISSTDPEVTDQIIDVMDGVEYIQTTSDNRQVTLLAADWVGDSAPYTQTVVYTGMTSSVVPEIGVVLSDTVETGIEQQKQWANITRAVSGTNSITFYCYKAKPTIDLTANVKVV